MKYIVKIPSMGGWNKAHIWKCGEPFGGQARIVSLCNRGGRSAPQAGWIAESWLNNNYPAISVETRNPMEKNANHCDRCLKSWLINIWEKP